MLQFILGGARSGKSRIAEQRIKQLAMEKGSQLVYLATGSAGDAEMAARIKHHQRNRGDEWLLVEEPLYLAKALKQYATEESCLLVDCLTLWTTNLMFDQNKQLWTQQRQLLLEELPKLPGDIVIVSNEVGQGIVPLGADNRHFVDEMGFLHQEVASLCDSVSFVIAGLVQELKSKH